MKKRDLVIQFPPHGDAEAVRRFEELTGIIQVVIVEDPETYQLLSGLMSDAVELCFDPDLLCIEEAHDWLRGKIAALNDHRSIEIPLPSFGSFRMRVSFDERSVGCRHLGLPRRSQRPRRNPEMERRKRAFWSDACDLFVEMRAAGMSIDGRSPRLDSKSLEAILPALNRAVGGQRAGFEPPPARWFRRKVGRMELDD